jgi:pyrroloquinoline quinone biosynthesis protein D
VGGRGALTLDAGSAGPRGPRQAVESSGSAVGPAGPAGVGHGGPPDGGDGSGGLSSTSRPRLAAKARLRPDRRTGGFLLLYPERGLALNATATDVVRLCTGEQTVDAIVETLAGKYGAAPRATIEAEVLAFLGHLADRGLLEPGDRAP